MSWGASPPSTQQPTNEPDDVDVENGKMSAGRQNTICGLRKKVFFFAILGGVLITVAAIAVGIGAGIAFNNHPSTPKQKILDTKSDISCPASNDAVLRSGDSYFRVRCGLDYPVSSGAVDLGTRDAPSFGRCAEMCASQDGCMGVAWRGGRCVLKESVGRSTDAEGMVLALGIQKPEGAD